MQKKTPGKPYKAKLAKAICALIQPSVYSLASRLFVLTTGRQGSKEYQPTVATFYETGVVTAIYEHLLMSPLLAHLEIRHEMDYKLTKGTGAPKQVDLWLRPPGGGYAHLIEAGDFTPGKVNRDLKKIQKLNPSGANWFLAFFRHVKVGSQDPWARIQKCFENKRGLDPAVATISQDLTGSFLVYRPDGNHDSFGFALFRHVGSTVEPPDDADAASAPAQIVLQQPAIPKVP